MLAAGFCHLIRVENDLYYGVFAACSTFSVYNLQRLVKSRQFVNTEWLDWVRKQERVLYMLVALAVMCAVWMLLLIGKFSWLSLILLIFSGVISVLYVLKIREKSLRDRSLLKIHLIAITWVAVLLVFPIVNEQPLFFEHTLGMAAVHYFYVFGITIPFDIRDLKYDDQHQRTIPQLVGVTGAKIIAVGALLVFVVAMLGLNQLLLANPLFYVAVLCQLLLVLFMTEQRGDIYCAGLIDGAIALLGLSYFV